MLSNPLTPPGMVPERYRDLQEQWANAWPTALAHWSRFTKLTDPRNFQSLGLVTDVELFLRELCLYLETEDAAAK